ncbi:MAG: hypothetical protein ABIA91_00375 [Patescibacteria group bacterium]
MKIAIAKSFNGLHNKYKKYFKQLGANPFLFNIDTIDWYNVEKTKKPNVYFWYADQKEERYNIILDKIYFIEKIIKKPVFPDSNMYFSFANKVRQYQIFKTLNLPTPKTFILTTKNDALRFIKKTKYPFIFKDPYGYDGLHVFKVDNEKQAIQKVKQIFSLGLKTGSSVCKDVFYTQEFIKTEKDLRLITIGKKAVCAYWRQGSSWKHNVHSSAQIKFDNIPKTVVDFCIRLSAKMNFHWMAYDFIVKPNNKFYLIEWSCNFGTKGADIQNINIRLEQSKHVIKILKK